MPAIQTSRPAAESALADRTLSGNGWLVALFLIVLLLPISFELAGLRLSPYRLFLLALIVPLSLRLLSGVAGRVNPVDICFLGFVGWMIVTLLYHHGLERLPYAVIVAVEMLGGYLVGRILIRSDSDFRRFIRYFLVALLILAPFAIHELLYSRMLIAEFLRPFFDVSGKNQEFRMNLSRVQVVFPHSIHFGLFCSLGLASVYYIYRSRPFQMVPRFLLVLGMTVMSLSSAPLLSAGMQIFMILWDKLTRGSWKLLSGLTLGVYVFLELFSNRGPVVLLIETMTLNPRTGWWRIHIWNYGTNSVYQHPIMGIGLNDWERPYWLASTVDNFWLLMAMRHGLIAAMFVCLAFALHFLFVVRARHVDPGTQSIRTGYLITLAGLLFVLATVHVWNEMAVFAMFFLGAGSFLYSAKQIVVKNQVASSEPAAETISSSPYSRFATRPRARLVTSASATLTSANRIGRK